MHGCHWDPVLLCRFFLNYDTDLIESQLANEEISSPENTDEGKSESNLVIRVSGIAYSGCSYR